MCNNNNQEVSQEKDFIKLKTKEPEILGRKITLKLI